MVTESCWRSTVPNTTMPSGSHPVAALNSNGEGILDQRWCEIAQIRSACFDGTLFSPRMLPTLLHSLLRDGPPRSPVSIGL